MKNYNIFIDEACALFERFSILDSNAVDNLNLQRCKGSFIAIAGQYFLNREFRGDVYQHSFDIVVLLDRTKHFVIPIVWLPNEQNPKGFEHLYKDNTCCLGLTHEVIRIWGAEQLAKDFFDKIVDIFLINLLSCRTIGKCATTEWSHGEMGIAEYYCEALNITIDECFKILPYIYYRVKRREYAKGHHQCPCESGKKVRNCHGEQINIFMKQLYSDTELISAFMQDLKVHMEKK